MTLYNKQILFLFVAFSLLGNVGFAADIPQSDSSKQLVFHFRFAKSVVDSGYMNNAVSLRELEQLLTDKSAQIDSVVITASGSPEGVVEYNQALATRRAKAMKGYIVRKYPHINQYSIFTCSIGEDWAGLRRLVEADGNAPHKEQVLKTLSQEINPATKEWRLKQIGGGEAWSYITNHYLRYLRAATTCVVYYKKQEIEKHAEQPIELPIPIPEEVDTVKQVIKEVPVTIEPTTEQPIASPQVETIKKPLFALKTNMLELAVGIANIGLEVRLGCNLSIDLPFAYSPYTKSSDYRIRVMMLRPELRYWFRGAFDGHFVGVHGIGGIYNVSVNSDTRYQSNRMAYGVGLSYGYIFRLSKHWGVELELGAGYVNTSYDCYYNVPNGMMYDSRNKHYWGITRASVSIVYLFNRKR